MTYSRVKGEGRKQLEIAFKQRALHGKVGKVGWVKPNQYPNGTQVALVAVIQEFGYPPKNIPPRSFMRTTIAEKQLSWRKVAYYSAQQVVSAKLTSFGAMEKIGAKAAGDIRKKIATITYPPLKPATIARRRARYSDKSTIGLLEKPLVDTRRMITTLSHSVEDA